ncbi:MAG: methionyl-tRNA formyltransferase [Clostridia bacterium]
MKKDIKVVFMGTPDFAATSLKALIDAKINVVGCFTNPDRPAGRGMKIQVSPVKQVAIENNIPVYQPEKLKENSEVQEKLREFNPDIIAVVAYGKILPKEILEFPRLGCINVHGSLLPNYRGSAPIQWSIINGDKKTGITTMYMDEGMDTGDMLLKENVDIEDDDNFLTIHDKLKDIGARLLVSTLELISLDKIIGIKQPEKCSIAPMITKEMTKIDFNKNSRDIFNFVRGLSPFPGAYITKEDGKIYKVYRVQAIYDESIASEIENGSILVLAKDKLYIKCADGYVKILEIQPPNSKRMDIASFLTGNRFSIAEKFI